MCTYSYSPYLLSKGSTLYAPSVFYLSKTPCELLHTEDYRESLFYFMAIEHHRMDASTVLNYLFICWPF